MAALPLRLYDIKEQACLFAIFYDIIMSVKNVGTIKFYGYGYSVFLSQNWAVRANYIIVSTKYNNIIIIIMMI